IMEYKRGSTLRRGQWTAFVFLLMIVHQCVGDIRYSITEEIKRGSVVGRFSQDLGIDVKTLSTRRPRIEFEGNTRYCDINQKTGDLIVNERMDREELCGQRPSCALLFDFFLENPLELHRVTLEIQDVNDNFPTFPNEVIKLEISESAIKGERFSIDEALDTDTGVNSVQGYTLSANEHFTLSVHTSADTGKYAEIVLEHELDREKQDELSLILTAYDGGKPQKSGTVVIQVRVLDANDNVPVFTQSIYKVSVPENATLGTAVVTVSASDADEGANGELTYEFSHISIKTKNTFSLDPKSGEIKIKTMIDFEDTSSFELRVKAKDGAGQAASCKVIVDVADINDNAPVILIKSLKSPLPENSPAGTEVALIYVQDRDSESNSKVRCSIEQNTYFKLSPSIKKHISLITAVELDRETQSEYNITLIATDEGYPPLSSFQTITLIVSDVNDNQPVFDEQSYSAYVTENNKPGSSLCYVTARDRDWRQNGTVVYSLLASDVDGDPLKNLFLLDSKTGVINLAGPIDYEEQPIYELRVLAKDGAGLVSYTKVLIDITDVNDNAPVILIKTLTNPIPENVAPRALWPWR
uniref:Cadherin domain-containing protein n=1 Tax=Hucho hucho TaxID=62062 RepID=A0A4W5K4A4_9TELE